MELRWVFGKCWFTICGSAKSGLEYVASSIVGKSKNCHCQAAHTMYSWGATNMILFKIPSYSHIRFPNASAPIYVLKGFIQPPLGLFKHIHIAVHSFVEVKDHIVREAFIDLLGNIGFCRYPVIYCMFEYLPSL